MTRALRLAVALSLAPMLLAGCSASSSAAPGADAGADGATLPGPLDLLVRGYCGAVRSCCAAAAFPLDPLANCEAEFTRQVDYFKLVTKGTVTIDPTALASCVATFDKLATTCVFRDIECARFAFGTVADGAPCDDSEECRGVSERPTACLKAGVMPGSQPKPGVCVAVPAAQQDEACVLTCEKGQDCSFTFTTSQTDPPVALCREEDGLVCWVGKCSPRVAEGAPCASDLACGSTSYCDTVCKPRKAEREPCTRAPECPALHSCTNGVCTVAPFPTTKVCGGNFN